MNSDHVIVCDPETLAHLAEIEVRRKAATPLAVCLAISDAEGEVMTHEGLADQFFPGLQNWRPGIEAAFKSITQIQRQGFIRFSKKGYQLTPAGRHLVTNRCISSVASSDLLRVEEYLRKRASQNHKIGRAKIERMKPTPIQIFEACDGAKLHNAVDRLARACGEDTDYCLTLFSDMLDGGFVNFVCPKGARETKVELTAAGREQLFIERTRLTSAKARSLLDEMEHE